MAAYVIAQLDVHDPEGYQEYVRRVPATIAAHGGRYLARSPEPALLEGSRGPRRAVIVEFPTVEHARGWFQSKEYEEIRPIRQRCATGTLLLVPGVS